MKLMIEVSGGVVCSIVATQECSIYLIDHDNIKERGGSAGDAKQAFQPYCITWEEGQDETPKFNEQLKEALEDYETKIQ
jgi:hypothetical protein